MNRLIGIISGFILLGFCVLIGVAINEHNQHPCIKSEVQNVHHDSYTTYMYVSKVMIPQYHAAYDDQESVCVEYK